VSVAAARPAWPLVWLAAIRPKTLGASVGPVLVGIAVAIGDGAFRWPAAAAALAGGVLLQVLANLVNDLEDFRRGADDERRSGPLRVCAAGWVSPEAMRSAIAACLGLFLVPAAYLAWVGGWVFVAIAATCVLFAFLYTAGPRPLAYLGLGDPAAFLFFGPVAAAGTYAAQAGAVTPVAWVASLMPGFLATALIAVNNLRDREGDARAGKRTVAVRIGDRPARIEIVACLVAAAAVPAGLAAFASRPGALLATLAALVLVPTARRVLAGERGTGLNACLASIGKSMFLVGLAFLVGWNLPWGRGG
jgi:1,4-dihydroxy-2-naphthoate octaprenyltransferase